VLWALTAAVTIAGALIALWPGKSTHEAVATVSIGRPASGQAAATFTFDAAPEARAPAVGKLIALVRTSPALDVHVVANARTRHGAVRAAQQTVDLVQAMARAELVGYVSATAPTPAEVQSKLEDWLIAASKLQAAQRRIDEWHREHGNADPAQQLAVVDAALARAQASTPRDDALITQLHARQTELTTAETAFTRLLDAHDAADRVAKRTKAAFDRAQSSRQAADARAQSAVVASDVHEGVVDTAGPEGRLALAAIFFIVAIGAADVLFLTRKRLALPHAEETSRARRARRRRQREQRRAHKPRTHRPSTAHSWHAWRADIDLTDEQRGDQGGPRTTELRDVHDPEDVPAQHRWE
jgi:hypothetical protein